MNRRKFLAIMGSAGVISALGTAKVANAGVHTFPYYADSYGVLHARVPLAAGQATARTCPVCILLSRSVTAPLYALA
jgi:hypothetical protein